uniref:Uncharacterized protein n=1 Tax=Manihot esculenta TaxID=3983 RepID=A0A2C9UYQ1_MANES
MNDSQPKVCILLLFSWLDEIYCVHGGQRLSSSVYIFYHCRKTTLVTSGEQKVRNLTSSAM